MEPTNRPNRTQRTGWWIVLVISVLMLLNGVGWFFGGPGSMLAYSARLADMPVDQYRATYPELAAHQARNVRQVAVWYAAFGSMSFLVAREGLRRGSRWAWIAMWPQVGAPIAIGIVYTPGGQLNAEGGFLIGVGVVVLLGLLMARPS